MASLQQDLDSAYPLLDIQILGVNEKGLDFSNGAITEGRDLPWLQDVDEDGNGTSDVWHDSWNVTYRDVVILDGGNVRFGTFNVTSNDLANIDNYEALRELLIDAAMETQKPWMNANNPLDVNNDGFIHPLDVLLVVNKINDEGSGDLPPPTGTELPTTFYDCSGDNLVSPLDVLRIVNFLNSQSDAGGESEASPAVGQSSLASNTFSSDALSTIADRLEAPASLTLLEATVEVPRWQREVDSVYSEIAERW